ncbi:MAG TPA: hypothetical protein VHX42_00885, partial [Candidatus Babeliales bacterium]|nr:hypothetical protein [Candidatus Babeliales bacterium]
MKKYNRSQWIVFLLGICNFFCINSMEMQPVQDDFCYVALLPPELWNYIARFLPWETSEECVQRTEREKDEGFPQEYYKYFGCKNALGVENLVG